ncbi:hypothetical protein ColLi_13099 [Colletotrichum liriopes]|uniref:F-box domain-containing protein n=1 Tax=Colletotrichum liriopes TaxID=708192 RepID=A0AA37H1I9_9PEZI|nr:hypothetical protein ColLi_13099 [Colletotrichum liriopes]
MARTIDISSSTVKTPSAADTGESSPCRISIMTPEILTAIARKLGRDSNGRTCLHELAQMAVTCRRWNTIVSLLLHSLAVQSDMEGFALSCRRLRKPTNWANCKKMRF